MTVEDWDVGTIRRSRRPGGVVSQESPAGLTPGDVHLSTRRPPQVRCPRGAGSLTD